MTGPHTVSSVGGCLGMAATLSSVSGTQHYTRMHKGKVLVLVAASCLGCPCPTAEPVFKTRLPPDMHPGRQQVLMEATQVGGSQRKLQAPGAGLT